MAILRKLKLYIRRVVPVLTSLVIVLACMVAPVSAAGADWTIDWNDYVTDIDVSGETGIVTVKLPREFYYIKVQDYLRPTDVWWGTEGKNLHIQLTEGRYYTVTFYSNPNKPFYLGNIPDGAVVSVTASVNAGTGVYSTPAAYSLFKTWDVNFKWLDDHKNFIDISSVTGNITGSIVVDKSLDDGKAYAGNFGIEFFGFEPLYHEYWDFEFLDLTISFPVSALTVDKIMNDQNRVLLNKINTELESQGQTLDSILSGTPEMNDQISNAVGEMQGASDKLAGASEALNSVDKPEIDTDDLIDGYTNFDPVGLNILSIMTSNSFVTDMMVIVFVFCLAGYIFFGKK